ncbi:exodeoxyribonuclease V subunit gamma [Klebsiella michiganensis]|nr:exodeoxyribonuclease V subunit gamma [Klebsiella michiganensis]
MTLLPQRLNDEAFTLLRHYLHDDSDKRKLFQLAARVADLYDQYLVYRPEWLMRWEADQRVDGLGDAQEWQAPLWKALVEYTAELGQPLWHRANLYQRFISALEAAEQPPAGLPSRVFICGISALPPVYLQALQALGKHVDVYVLFTNPCRYYWGDIKDPAFLAKLLSASAATTAKRRESCPCFAIRNRLRGYSTMPGNRMSAIPLLASWGKLGRDYIYLLAGLERYEELDAFVDIAPDNLLHNLQADILELRNAAVAGRSAEEFANSRSKRLLAANDRSLSIHVCHSPQREVEVLHDRLLAMLEENPELTPRDIIVMVADIDSYSPIFRRSSAAPAASAGCRGRYPTGGPANRIRRCRRLSPCFRCPTAALPAKTCWRCWMCRCWPRALTLTKRGYATCASGLTNPAYAGEWMTTTCVNSISRLPASIPGAWPDAYAVGLRHGQQRRGVALGAAL